MELGYISKATVQKQSLLCAETHKSSVLYSRIVDLFCHRLGSSDLLKINIETQHKKICFYENPGMRDYMQNIVLPLCRSEVALCVIPAVLGDFEASLSQAGYFRIALQILKITNPLCKIIVAVNKCELINQQRYEEVEKETQYILKRRGFNVEEIPFIPISALTGENIISSTGKFDWYKGPTLLQVLDSVKISSNVESQPLRIVVKNCFKLSTNEKTVVVGDLISGALEVDSPIFIAPGNITALVDSLEIEQVQHSKLVAPQENIAFIIDGVSHREVSKGAIIGDPKWQPPSSSTKIIAMIYVIYGQLSTKADRISIQGHDMRRSVSVNKILARYDKGGKPMKENETLEMRYGESYLLELYCEKEFVFDFPPQAQQLCVFKLQQYSFLAAGVIKK